MKILIVVDANVILSALLGGSARFILFKREFEFVTTNFTIKEVKKYLDVVVTKSGVSKKEIVHALSLLPIKVCSGNFYRAHRNKAKELINSIDPKDIDILALVLKLNTYLWSEDRHFEEIKNHIKLIKTESLI